MPDIRMRFWDLAFRDGELERDFRASYFDTDIKRARVGLVFGAVVLLFFAIFEPFLLGSPPLVNQVRLLFVLPVIALLFIATFTSRRYFHLQVACGSVLVTLSQIMVLPAIGAEIVTNTTMAYLQYLLFITVLLFQPFRYLVVQVIFLVALMSIALRTVGGDSNQIANYEVACQSISLIALMFAYLREQSQRQLFAAGVEVRILRNETERQQANQISWLRNLSRYLEHEIRNHVFIAQSNLEFMQQDVQSEQRPFVRRALRSLGKLSELCDSVGEASTLESALQHDRFYPVNFSRMVAERVLERARDLDESNPLELDVDPDLWVKGSEARLLQVFDSLLNNALEYSSEDAFVRLEVKGVAGSVYFTVHNRGEPLADGRNTFAAYESTRPKTSLGLGLYVARKIVEHHGGSIEARNQLGQTIVMVQLPSVQAPVSLVTTAQAQAGADVLNIDLMMKRRAPGDGSERK